MNLDPFTLRGSTVELRPLARSDHDGLVAAASDGELWRLGFTKVASPAGMAAAVEGFLARQERGELLPFTVTLVATGAVVGATTFCNIDAVTPRVEIGGTWYARRVQRTAVNTEAKLLLLTHAFERFGCIAVEFRTSSLNLASQRAIERLGARRDAVLRSHAIMPNGTLRDTVVYSITAAEWPAVRAELHRRLDA